MHVVWRNPSFLGENVPIWITGLHAIFTMGFYRVLTTIDPNSLVVHRSSCLLCVKTPKSPQASCLKCGQPFLGPRWVKWWDEHSYTLFIKHSCRKKVTMNKHVFPIYIYMNMRDCEPSMLVKIAWAHHFHGQIPQPDITSFIPRSFPCWSTQPTIGSMGLVYLPTFGCFLV